jgi:steroid delta-isomerase-like uncharacterized protein
MSRIDVNSYVQTFEAAMNSGDPAAGRRLFAPGFVDHAPWPGQSPDAAGFEAGMAEMLAAFPDINVKVERTVTEDDYMTVHFIMSGTQLGPFMGAPASGKTFRAEVVDILRFVDGQVIEHWGVMDAAAMAEQLGLLPRKVRRSPVTWAALFCRTCPTLTPFPARTCRAAPGRRVPCTCDRSGPRS